MADAPSGVRAETSRPEPAAFALKQLKRFRQNVETALETGGVDAVHDLRVASRRLNEPLMLMQEVLDDGSSRSARRQLRRLRRAFRRVRDLDVLRASLHEEPIEPRLASHDLTGLVALLDAERDRAIKKAQRKCRRLDHAGADRLVRRQCVKWPDDEDAQSQFRARLVELWTRRIEALQQLDPRRQGMSDLHPARIAVKKLRYCTELLDRVAPPADDILMRELTTMQSLLGHWNDLVAAARRIARVAARRTHLAARPGWSARLMEHATARVRAADEDRRRIADGWPALDAAIANALREHANPPIATAAASAEAPPADEATSPSAASSGDGA